MWFKKNDKEKYIQKETERMEKIIEMFPKEYPFAVEIKREGVKHTREGIRQEYDRLKEEMAAAKAGIEKEMKLPEKDRNKKALAIWDKMIKDREHDIPQLEEMIKGLDKEMEQLNPEFVKKQVIKRIEGARAYLDLLNDIKKK